MRRPQPRVQNRKLADVGRAATIRAWVEDQGAENVANALLCEWYCDPSHPGWERLWVAVSSVAEVDRAYEQAA